MLSFCLHGSSSCSVLWSDRVKYYPLILYFKWKLFEVLFQSDQRLKTNVKFWLLWYAFDKQTFDKWEWLFKVHYARVFNKSFWNRYLLESSLWILKSFLLNEKYVTLNKKKLKCRSKIFAHNLKNYDIQCIYWCKNVKIYAVNFYWNNKILFYIHIFVLIISI